MSPDIHDATRFLNATYSVVLVGVLKQAAGYGIAFNLDVDESVKALAKEAGTDDLALVRRWLADFVADVSQDGTLKLAPAKLRSVS